jgi:hypothetical protein
LGPFGVKFIFFRQHVYPLQKKKRKLRPKPREPTTKRLRKKLPELFPYLINITTIYRITVKNIIVNVHVSFFVVRGVDRRNATIDYGTGAR